MSATGLLPRPTCSPRDSKHDFQPGIVEKVATNLGEGTSQRALALSTWLGSQNRMEPILSRWTEGYEILSPCALLFGNQIDAIAWYLAPRLLAYSRTDSRGPSHDSLLP